MFPGSVIFSPLGSGSSKSDFISLTFLAGLQEHRSAIMSDVVHITMTACTAREIKLNLNLSSMKKNKHNPGIIVMIMLRAVKP